MEHFGSEHPTVAEFDRAYADHDNGLHDGIRRWSGRCTVLYEGGSPIGCAFWGVSGD